MKLSKTMKKVLAYICAFAMVVTSMTGYQAKVSADEDVPEGYTLLAEGWTPMGETIDTTIGDNNDPASSWNVYVGTSWSGASVAAKDGADGQDTISVYGVAKASDDWGIQLAKVFQGLTAGTKYNYEINYTLDGVAGSWKSMAKADDNGEIKVVKPLGNMMDAGKTLTVTGTVCEEPDPSKVSEYVTWLPTARNLAYGKHAAVSSWKEGSNDAANGYPVLTDATWDKWNGNYVGINTPGYFEIDLGATYKSSSIDQVVVWFRTADPNLYPKDGFKVQFGDVSFDTVATVQAADYPTDAMSAQEDGAQYMVPIVLDKANINGNVKKVRIQVDSNVAWGAQITEIAVFAENPEEGEVAAPAENPAGVVVSSEKSSAMKGEIKVNITAGEGQEDYTYLVYLDDSTIAALTGCVAGTDYTITGVPAGKHTVKVISVYNGGTSEGIVSDVVTVRTIVDDVAAPSKNLALGKEWELLAAEGSNLNHGSAEGDGDITNGVISANDFVCPAKATDGAYYIIDLGKEVEASTIKNIGVWYRVMEPGCAPDAQNSQDIQYSTDKDIWTDVVSVPGQDIINARAEQGSAPYGIITDLSAGTGTVRYIRVYYPKGVAYGAQVTEIAIFGETGTDVPGTTVAPTTTEEATEAPGVEPIKPEGLLVSSPEAGKISVEWGQGPAAIENGQLYNIYVDDALVRENVICAKYIIDATPGEHTVSVVAVLGDKVSEAASATVTVEKVEEKVTWELQQGGDWESSIFDYNGFTVTDIPANKDSQWTYGARIVAPIVEAEKTYNVTLKFTSTVNKYLYIELGSDKTEVVATPEGAEVTTKITTGADLLKMYVRLGYDPAKDTEVTEAYSVTLDEVKVEEVAEEQIAELKMGEPEVAIKLGNAFRHINLTWEAYEGAAKYTAYYQYDGNAAFNYDTGFKFQDMKTQTNIINVACTTDGTPNRIIVYAFDADGNKIARGIKEVVASELTPYEKACAEVTAKNEAKLAERLAKFGSEENFAKGKTANIQLTPGTGDKKDPANMLDGDIGTSWQASAAGSGTEKDPAQQLAKSVVEVDLGEVKNIGSVMIAWQNAYALEYDVYVAGADGAYGDTPITKGTIADGLTDPIISHDLAEKVDAQYIKLVPTKLRSNAVQYGIRIYEIGVFADATSVVLEDMPKEEDYTTQAPTTTEAPTETPTETSTEAPAKDPIVMDMELLAPENDNNYPVGGYNVYVGQWNGSTAIAGVDAKDADHIKIQQKTSNWNQAWGLQVQKKFTGLAADTDYTIEWKVLADNNDGKVLITNGGNTEIPLTGAEQILTASFKTDATGTFEFSVGMGWVGISNAVEFFAPVVKDADGNVVYPKDEETTTPGETSTEAPSETSTEAPSETSTEAPSETSTEAPSETSTEASSETTTGAENTTTPKQDVTTAAPAKVKAPGKVKIAKVSAKKLASTKAKLSLKKVNGAKGYQVAVYKTKKLAKKNKKALVKKFVKKVKAIVKSKKLKNKKTLFVRVRAYALSDGKKIYGKWSKVKKIKVK